MDLRTIREASERIRPMVHRTPVMTSRLFNEATGKSCFFKCENLQRAGAFKIRGAANFLLSINEQERNRGVVAFSSGNHAQAVALAARELGMKATIVMPTDAPPNKLAGTQAYGANVVLYDRLTEDREAISKEVAERTGAFVVPPFDHEWIIAGQGTAALELMEVVPDLDAVAVCIGGGGLSAGSSIAAKGLNPKVRVFGVEPEKANDTYLSFRAGERIGIDPPDTIADGLRSPKPGALTFPTLQRNLEDIVLVSEQEIRETAEWIGSRMKIVVEPSGAVAPAALLAHRLPQDVERIGIIISGGNV